jgi:hypothetical protein
MQLQEKSRRKKMPLWGNLDGATGNSKPKYANVASTLGVSVTEQSNTQAIASGNLPAHSGWVKQILGTGGIATITISSGGTGINAAGFLTISGGGGTGANVSYTTANSQNTLQSYSSNSAWNVVATVVVNNPGTGFTSAPTVTYTGANSTRPTFTATVGGRAGRKFYETLVATGTIIGEDTADNTYFPGT